jgi:iron(II)-dependent oxidoreductase
MATDALKSTLSSPAGAILDGLAAAREETLALVQPLDTEQLERVHSPIMSPLVWDLGHIAAYEDLWIGHRLGGRELLRADLAALYDAFETPRAVRGDIEVLRPDAARAYLAEVRERTAETLAESTLDERALEIGEMVIRHELQHCETMRQTLAIAGLLSPADRAAGDLPLDDVDGGAHERVWIAVPAGPFEIGADSTGFAYDNERPRHTTSTEAFEIARLPLSNGDALRFAAEGGYRRRELWSAEGWQWLATEPQPQHPAIAAGEPRGAACHLSWFEADAIARAAGARLPSEIEWEKAAGRGSLASIGRVWEWTQSEFDGYRGFVAHPYREYSEVFFANGYRVLRGGSWATSERVRNRHFRNWDLPQRRQIFAGVRLARDAR